MTKNLFLTFFLILTLCFISPLALALEFKFNTRKDVYSLDEKISVSIDINNIEKGEYNLDFYFVILSPFGKIITLPVYENGIHPVVPLIISQNFNVTWEFLINAKDIFNGYGIYYLGCGFANKDTLEFPWGISIKEILISKFQPDNTCPENMVLIPEGQFTQGDAWGDSTWSQTLDPFRVYLNDYCIDIYEYPNLFFALPREFDSYYEAENACIENGKTICTESQWEKACKGPEENKFPFGNEWLDATCWTSIYSSKMEPMPSGTKSSCVSSYGLYDMTGNVSEMIATEKGTPKGTVKSSRIIWYQTYFDRCDFRYKGSPGGVRHYGSRCCLDLE